MSMLELFMIVSEMAAYFYSFKIISQYGHVKVRALYDGE
jgi:hypothetical protein